MKTPHIVRPLRYLRDQLTSVDTSTTPPKVTRHPYLTLIEGFAKIGDGARVQRAARYVYANGSKGL